MSHEGSIAALAIHAQGCGSYSETDGSRWYCVRTHPRQEYQALLRLAQQGFRAHLPRYVSARQIIRQPKKNGSFRDLVTGKLDEKEDIIRALFPGYMFVQFDRTREQWRSVVSTIGIASLFMTSDFTPTPVARGIVERLIAKGRPGDGVIDDQYRGPDMPKQLNEANDITAGMAVRITSGPFADVHGICTMSWQKRNELLISALGGDVKVTVDRADIEVV